jgi:hypothetical protein
VHGLLECYTSCGHLPAYQEWAYEGTNGVWLELVYLMRYPATVLKVLENIIYPFYMNVIY